jgi:hypothetical protein
VRAGQVAPDNASLVVSGSYDHTVRLWDVRTGACTLTMQHGAPVEALLVFPGAAVIVSAGTDVGAAAFGTPWLMHVYAWLRVGANEIKVWDVLGGGRELRTVSHHQKTITSLSLDGARAHLLSGSLDHYVKVYSVADYKVWRPLLSRVWGSFSPCAHSRKATMTARWCTRSSLRRPYCHSPSRSVPTKSAARAAAPLTLVWVASRTTRT